MENGKQPQQQRRVQSGREFESEPSDEWREDYGRGGPVRSDEPERDWFFEANAAPTQRRAHSLEQRATRSGPSRKFLQGEEPSSQSYRGFGPKGYRPRDERIRERVCERLAEHPHVDARELVVAVERGIVSITGIVPLRPMRYAIEEALADIHGIVRVENEVRVNDGRFGREGMERHTQS
jgi:hypothetical protein